MLDDMNVLDQFGVNEYVESLNWLSLDINSKIEVLNFPKNPKAIEKIIFITDSFNPGFALVQSFLKYGVESKIPAFTVTNTDLNDIDSKSLVIIDDISSSKSILRNKLIKQDAISVWLMASMPKSNAPAVIYSPTNHPEIDIFKACLKALYELKLIEKNIYLKISSLEAWLRGEQKKWQPAVTFDKNLPKKVAIMLAGKTGLIITSRENEILGQLFVGAVANISKNLAFNDQIENLLPYKATGWLSQPIEKLFAVVDVHSSLDSINTQNLFAIKNRLLSGRMPASYSIKLEGNSRIEQYLYGLLLFKYCAAYLAVINKQSIRDSHFSDKLKLELSK